MKRFGGASSSSLFFCWFIYCLRRINYNYFHFTIEIRETYKCTEMNPICMKFWMRRTHIDRITIKCDTSFQQKNGLFYELCACGSQFHAFSAFQRLQLCINWKWQRINIISRFHAHTPWSQKRFRESFSLVLFISTVPFNYSVPVSVKLLWVH